MNLLLPFFLADSTGTMLANPWLSLGVFLLGLAAMISVLSGLLRRSSTAVVVLPAPTVAAPAPALVAAEELPGETLAIIAACVAVCCGKSARITSVSAVASTGEMLIQTWSLEGRRQVFSSHQFR